uniref:Uncharacterized protein n=1 Tax=Arcella intermedia TaxID=1963864 RepID=A0A6B2KXP8_9EUKA
MRIYEMNEKSTRGKECFEIHYPDDESLASPSSIYPVSTFSDISNLKCLAWAPKGYTESDKIAMGIANGRVILSSVQDIKTLKEFVPRHNRGCNAVAWNTKHQNLIASGLEKVRNDSSTLVWDVNANGTQTTRYDLPLNTETFLNISGNIGVPVVTDAMNELNIPESTLALAWMPQSDLLLAAGAGYRILIFDLKVSTFQPCAEAHAHAKSVNGVLVNPFNNYQLATFSEDGLIKIWDVKKLNESIFSISTKPLSQVSWCPTRLDLIASCYKTESCIRIWDLKSAIGQSAEKEKDNLNLVPREYSSGLEPISSFAWHPTDEKRILTLNHNGGVQVLRIHEPIPVAYSPCGNLAVGFAKDLLEGNPDLRSLNNEGISDEALKGNLDISFVMQERAHIGYSSNIPKNCKEVVNRFHDPALKSVWKWVHKMKFKFRVKELKGFLRLIQEQKAPDSTHTSLMKFKIYSSTERTLCAKFCNWGWKDGKEFEAALAHYEDQGQSSKAAALSIFHFNLKRALRSFKKQIENSLDKKSKDIMGTQLIAMALSGYQESSQLWKSTCTEHAINMEDPYIQAIFRFLALDADNPNYDNLLSPTSKMSLFDKVAFACRFLEYKFLVNFLTATEEQVTNSGDIEGLLITGLSESGRCVELLQNYLNKTGDIQTVACLVCHVPDRRPSGKFEQWIHIYRSLLNRWQMWFERAKFDVDRVPNNEIPTQPHVFATCKFCNTSFTLGRDAVRRRTGNIERSQPVQKKKVSQCPSCAKPLPKCSICLLPMECTPFDPRNINTGIDQYFWSSSTGAFDSWFSWCQTCKHGGHVGHLKEWFSRHKECPVADCSCRCYSLD